MDTVHQYRLNEVLRLRPVSSQWKDRDDGNVNLGLLTRCAAASLQKLARDPRYLGARLGCLAVLHTWTRAMQYQPHVHMLVTDGLVSADGSLVSIPCPDPVCPMEVFRLKLIKVLLGRERISPHLVEIMQNWTHPGFSVFQGEAIAPDDHEARRHLAGYMVNVLSFFML
jgi:hypothetical protein